MLNIALQDARAQPENGYALRDGQRYAVLHEMDRTHEPVPTSAS